MSEQGTPNPTPAPAPAPSPTAAAPPAATWYQSTDAEFVGTLQNRGLDKKTAAEAAYDFYKAHKNAEKFIGAPASELIRVPKPDAPEADKAAYYEKLGRPQKPDGYDFKEIKFSNGDALDDDFVGVLRNAAFKGNLSSEAANAVARDLTAYLEKVEKDAATNDTAERTAEMEALKKSWGANYEANEFVANQGFKKAMEAAGFTQEQMVKAVQQLGATVGKANAMQLLLAVGKMTGEARYVAGNPQNNSGIMTREQAKAALAQKKGDTEWLKKFHAGDITANNEFEALVRMTVGAEGEYAR